MQTDTTTFVHMDEFMLVHCTHKLYQSVAYVHLILNSMQSMQTKDSLLSVCTLSATHNAPS